MMGFGFFASTFLLDSIRYGVRYGVNKQNTQDWKRLVIRYPLF